MAEARRASRRTVERICSGGEQTGAEDLEHDWSLEEGVVCQIDDAAAACAEAALNLIMCNGFARHG